MTPELYEDLKKQLIEHEGFRTKPYLCTAKKLTIGVGRNIEDVGISKSEVLFLLQNDIYGAERDLFDVLPSFPSLPDKIQMVLIDMMFNLGKSRFIKFKNMIKAIKEHDWCKMIDEMIDSKWYNDVGRRADNLIALIYDVISEEDNRNV